jgi:hypothetical protein
MGNCLNCGASFLFSTPNDKCNWCGKVTCKKCLPVWPDSFSVKNAYGEAKYERIPFCSMSCGDSFWQTVMNYPLENIGTDIEGFNKNLRKLFYYAIQNALNGKAKLRVEAIDKVNRAINKDTQDFIAIPMPTHRPYVSTEFVKLGYSALALNLEKCGRHLDAAEIYEKKLKMYDKARLIRQNEKQVIAKSEKGKELLQTVNEETDKPKELSTNVTIKETIIREIVKIRCVYCHKIYDESENRCPNCGASR